jgi:hypothetical protein
MPAKTMENKKKEKRKKEVSALYVPLLFSLLQFRGRRPLKIHHLSRNIPLRHYDQNHIEIRYDNQYIHYIESNL